MGIPRIAGACAACALLAGTASVASGATSKPGQPGFADTLTVQSVDPAKKTFTAGESGESQQFTVDGGTYLFKKDRQIRLGDLSVGDRVAVSYPLRDWGDEKVLAKVVQVVTRPQLGDR